MAYTISLKKSVEHDIKKLSPDIWVRIKERIFEHLPENANKFSKLTNDANGTRRLRVGKYRVLYVIKGNKVIITGVGPRADIYKKK